MTDQPNWTVVYNVVSKESRRWIGTGWEFFDLEEDATACYDRLIADGHCPCKRPFFAAHDTPHLGAAHR